MADESAYFSSESSDVPESSESSYAPSEDEDAWEEEESRNNVEGDAEENEEGEDQGQDQDAVEGEQEEAFTSQEELGDKEAAAASTAADHAPQWARKPQNEVTRESPCGFSTVGADSTPLLVASDAASASACSSGATPAVEAAEVPSTRRRAGRRRSAPRRRATDASVVVLSSGSENESLGLSSDSSVSDDDDDVDNDVDNDVDADGDADDTPDAAAAAASSPVTTGASDQSDWYDVSQMVVGEMRVVLRKHGLSPSGKRPVLEQKVHALNAQLGELPVVCTADAAKRSSSGGQPPVRSDCSGDGAGCGGSDDDDNYGNVGRDGSNQSTGRSMGEKSGGGSDSSFESINDDDDDDDGSDSGVVAPVSPPRTAMTSPSRHEHLAHPRLHREEHSETATGCASSPVDPAECTEGSAATFIQEGNGDVEATDGSTGIDTLVVGSCLSPVVKPRAPFEFVTSRADRRRPQFNDSDMSVLSFGNSSFATPGPGQGNNFEGIAVVEGVGTEHAAVSDSSSMTAATVPPRAEGAGSAAPTASPTPEFKVMDDDSSGGDDVHQSSRALSLPLVSAHAISGALFAPTPSSASLDTPHQVTAGAAAAAVADTATAPPSPLPRVHNHHRDLNGDTNSHGGGDRDLDMTVSPVSPGSPGCDSPSNMNCGNILRTVRKMHWGGQHGTPSWSARSLRAHPNTTLRTFSAVLSTRARPHQARATDAGGGAGGGVGGFGGFGSGRRSDSCRERDSAEQGTPTPTRALFDNGGDDEEEESIQRGNEVEAEHEAENVAEHEAKATEDEEGDDGEEEHNDAEEEVEKLDDADVIDETNRASPGTHGPFRNDGGIAAAGGEESGDESFIATSDDEDDDDDGDDRSASDSGEDTFHDDGRGGYNTDEDDNNDGDDDNDNDDDDGGGGDDDDDDDDGDDDNDGDEDGNDNEYRPGPSNGQPACASGNDRRRQPQQQQQQQRRRRQSSVFRAHRGALTAEYFVEFNRVAFDGRLPADLKVSWNKRLLRTAGLTYTQTDARSGAVSARVELSCKVLDTERKCRSTLLHELCHVAARLLSNCTAKCCGPHGAHFKQWARQAGERTGLKVTTCHAYTIFQPFQYVCTNAAACGHRFGRHSKSVNLQTQSCARCHGRLEFWGKVNRDGTRANHGSKAAFNTFSAALYPKLQAQHPQLASHEVSALVRAKWDKRLTLPGRSGGGDDGNGEDEAENAAQPRRKHQLLKHSLRGRSARKPLHSAAI